MGNGRYYMGTVNVTSSGKACQPWDSQKPHSHIQPPNVFPQVQNAENYCRNAGGEERYPWCYTMDESVRWQHCDVPLCRKLQHIIIIIILYHLMIFGFFFQLTHRMPRQMKTIYIQPNWIHH